MTALHNIELASFLRWYVAVELYDPAYAKRFYCTYEILEENMVKVSVLIFPFLIIFVVIFLNINTTDFVMVLVSYLDLNYIMCILCGYFWD